MGELIAAGEAVFSELKNVCVWNKTNGGMGSFYRSKHELVFVFKVGTAPHTNTFGLGDTGRYRTNVWPLAPDKRSLLLERIYGWLRYQGIRRPTDDDIRRALSRAIRGLMQTSAAVAVPK